MIVYYGTKGSHLKNGEILNVDCPNCGEYVSMIYTVYGRYAHLYLIPFFPIKKVTFAECNSCKKTFEFYQLPSPIKEKLKNEQLRDGIKNPIWMFSGLLLVATLIIFGFYSSFRTDANNEKFINDPKVGDIYYIHQAKGGFTTLKVNQVLKDSIIIFVNDMEIDKKTNIDEIDMDKYYTKKFITSKKYILDLYKSQGLYEVNRN